MRLNVPTVVDLEEGQVEARPVVIGFSGSGPYNPSRVSRQQPHQLTNSNGYLIGTIRGIRVSPVVSSLSYGSPPANKASVLDFSLTLDPVLFSGRHRGNLDDSRAEIIVTRLRSKVRTGTGTTSCVPIVWREGTGHPRGCCG